MVAGKLLFLFFFFVLVFKLTAFKNLLSLQLTNILSPNRKVSIINSASLFPQVPRNLKLQINKGRKARREEERKKANDVTNKINLLLRRGSRRELYEIFYFYSSFSFFFFFYEPLSTKKELNNRTWNNIFNVYVQYLFNKLNTAELNLIIFPFKNQKPNSKSLLTSLEIWNALIMNGLRYKFL